MSDKSDEAAKMLSAVPAAGDRFYCQCKHLNDGRERSCADWQTSGQFCTLVITRVEDGEVWWKWELGAFEDYSSVERWKAYQREYVPEEESTP